MRCIILDVGRHVKEFERVAGSLYVTENLDIYIAGSSAFFSKWRDVWLSKCLVKSAEFSKMDYKILDLTDEYRKIVEQVFSNTWGGVKIAVHRQLFDLSEMSCKIALSTTGTVLGYCYYRFVDKSIEVMVLESLHEKIGIGTALLETLKDLVRKKGNHRIYLQTTNDNLQALGFYQRRGFCISAIDLHALDIARKLKPTIPLIGDNNIPLMHEIELELLISEF